MTALDTPATTMSVRDPARGGILREVPVVVAEEVAALAARARAAQPDWAALGIDGRARILGRLQKAVIDEADRLVDVIVAESGKTRDDALNLEIPYISVSLSFWRSHAASSTWGPEVVTL
jgi:acyl-CoA reductase-like NAD-dependent aldehyde dehydrogenase